MTSHTNVESSVEQRVKDFGKRNTRAYSESLGLFVNLEMLPLTQIQR